MAAGSFRADLCYRLNGYTIVLPPLRERREDIRPLVEHYVQVFNAEIGKAITGIAPETMERLVNHSWPGNIRELQTVLKHAMLHAVGTILVPEFLPPELRESTPAVPPPTLPAVVARAVVPAPAVPPDATEPPPQYGDAAFSGFIEEQLRGETTSLYADCVKRMESVLLTHVLRHTGGNQSQAASLLGITRGSLRNKLRQQGIMISSSIAIQDHAEEGR